MHLLQQSPGTSMRIAFLSITLLAEGSRLILNSVKGMIDK